MSGMTSRRLMVACIILAICIAAFCIDLSRCAWLKAPVFAIPVGVSADDGGSRTYLGLGYTVRVTKYIDPEYGLCICGTEMRLLGIFPVLMCIS